MRFRRTLAVASMITSMALACQLYGQSTSSWIPIQGEPLQTSSSIRPTKGSTYVSVLFRGASVYQQSNWWTSFVEKKRQAVLSISVDGNIRGIHVQDTRASSPIELRKNRTNVDFGYSDVPIFQKLPTTFDSISVTVAISKTAEDGLQSLMTGLADISKGTPGLKVSDQSFGVVSGVKMLADYLFNKQLLVPKINSPSAISSDLRPAGLYVILAGDSQSDYDQYLTSPPGRQGLRWENGRLTWNDQTVRGISYFVVEINYSQRVFADPLDALSYGTLRPWSALYQLTRREIYGINKTDDTKSVIDTIRSHLSAARTFLDSDPDYVQAERDAIDNAVRNKVQEELEARLAKLGPVHVEPASQSTTPSQPSEAVPGPAEPPDSGIRPGGPWVLLGPEDKKPTELLRQMQSEEQRERVLQTIEQIRAEPPERRPPQ